MELDLCNYAKEEEDGSVS